MKSEVTKRLLVRLSLITNVFGALVATGNVNLPSSNHIRSTRDLLLAVISSSKRSRVLLPINSCPPLPCTLAAALLCSPTSITDM